MATEFENKVTDILAKSSDVADLAAEVVRLRQQVSECVMVMKSLHVSKKILLYKIKLNRPTLLDILNISLSTLLRWVDGVNGCYLPQHGSTRCGIYYYLSEVFIAAHTGTISCGGRSNMQFMQALLNYQMANIQALDEAAEEYPIECEEIDYNKIAKLYECQGQNS